MQLLPRISAQRHFGGGFDVSALATAVSMRSKVSAWQAAVLHFWASQSDVISKSASAGGYNAAMSAYLRGSNWQNTLKLFAALRHQEREDAVSFATAITACATGAQWILALALLSLFQHTSRQRGLAVSSVPILHAAAISACGHCELWERALLLLDSLRDLRLEEHVPASNAAMSACEAGLFLITDFNRQEAYMCEMGRRSATDSPWPWTCENTVAPIFPTRLVFQTAHKQ